MRGRAGSNRFESIRVSTKFCRVNRIPVEFNLSGRLQSRCQQCVSVGNKTAANGAIL